MPTDIAEPPVQTPVESTPNLDAPQPPDRDALTRAIEEMRKPAAEPKVEPVVKEPAKPSDAPELKETPKKDEPVKKVEEPKKAPTNPLEKLEAMKAEKPEPKVEKEDPDEEIPADVLKTPKAKETWGILKNAKKALTARVAELEKQLSDTPRADVAETTKLKEAIAAKEAELANKNKLIEEKERKVALMDVRESEEYVANVTKPMDDNLTFLRSKAEQVEGSADQVDAAMRLTDPTARNKALSELYAQLDPITFDEVKQAIQFYDIAKRNRAFLEERASTAREVLKVETEAKDAERKAAMTKDVAQAQETAYDKLKDKFTALKDEVRASAIKGAGSFLLEEPTPEKLALGGMALEAMIHSEEIITELTSELKELKANLARREAANPTISTTVSGDEPAPADDLTADPRDRLTASIRASRGF